MERIQEAIAKARAERQGKVGQAPAVGAGQSARRPNQSWLKSDDDELVEVTPVSIRLRKRLLKEHERKRASRAA